jgi:hypothetical protein
MSNETRVKLALVREVDHLGKIWYSVTKGDMYQSGTLTFGGYESSLQDIKDKYFMEAKQVYENYKLMLSHTPVKEAVIEEYLIN